MSFVIEKLIGGQEYKEDVLLSNVSVTKNTILYGASGYATNATVGNAKTHNIVGVVQETVDNSGGSAGDLSALIEQSPLALYRGDTTGTPAQSQMWTNVTLDAVATIDEDDSADTDTGIVKLRKLISTTNKKVLCSLNFWSPADS